MKTFRLFVLATLLAAGPVLTAQSAAAKPTMPASKASANQPGATAAVTKAANPNSNAPLDINTASPDQLMQLPGIGAAYSKRIIDGRPYTAKNQLESRGILPKATYEAVAGQIIAKRPAKK